MDKYKELYQNNKDFKSYVDRLMRNKNISLEETLEKKVVRSVGDMYEKESVKYEKA